jgi:hypothetical protein
MFSLMLHPSCKKNEIAFDFAGNITDKLTGNPISGVKFELSQKTVQNGTTSVNYLYVGSDVTDNQGNYAFSTGYDKVTSFKFQYKKSLYFPIEIEETTANVSTENLNIYDQEMEPQSWIEFDVQNFGSSEDDHLKILTQKFREGCEGCAENTSYSYFGALDTSIYYTTTAGEYVKFTFINVSDGYSQTDSLYAIPFDTVRFAFNY